MNGTVSEFEVLFTAQKTKKAKTWQDGFLTYHSLNNRMVLIDEKLYPIDKKFYKRGIPSVGDEIEFDGHIVTIESFLSAQHVNNTTAPASVKPPPITPVRTSPIPPPTRPVIASPALRQQYKPPMISTVKERDSDEEMEEVEDDIMEVSGTPIIGSGTAGSNRPFGQLAVQPAIQPTIQSSNQPNRQPMQIDEPSTPAITHPVAQTTSIPQKRAEPVHDAPKSTTTLQKRVRVGLTKRGAPMLHRSLMMTTPHVMAARTETNSAIPSSSAAAESSFMPASKMSSEDTSLSDRNSTVQPLTRPVSADLSTSPVFQFPNQKKAMALLKSKKFPKRSKVVPVKFASGALYKETYKKIIHEHLDIVMLNFAMYFYTIYEKFCKNKSGSDLERIFRSKGIGMYANTELKGDARLRLQLKHNREHYSKYNKDDIWVISKVATFESSQTFLTKSSYYGPFADGSLELECISARDSRVAAKMLKEKPVVYAIRSISASTELMMLKTLDDKLDQLPLLPYILQDPISHMKKKKNQVAPPTPLPIMDHIKITREDGIDVEARMNETIALYKLNEDQAIVLRRVAKSVITAPNWNSEPERPIVLVHGVYGSGKSFLAAVIIVFIQELVDCINERREPKDNITYKILVSSMTNVAVDRILQTLLKLGYDHFIRIGSMKKIAKPLLPYTSKARLTSTEELKELEQMLQDPLNSEEDSDHISTAIQRFRKLEGNAHIQQTQVVGTTFMSSMFEVFNNVKFPLVLVDESSQLMEPLTMVPLARFSCHRLIMIGDPLQLPPTLTTNAEEGKISKGLDKTLFDRMIEMGQESVMLRTQYRCHPRISNISNKLFYDCRLLNGVTNQDRKPLIDGFPTLLFVDVGGTEKKSLKTNSFYNENEVAIAAHLIQNFISTLNISPSDVGVISLYKEQADRLSGFLTSGSTDTTSSKNVQISTVDAFQGGEKEIILLSTVRTTDSQFMDNQPRINVALTRAKRHLIILGNKSLFTMNELWSKVLWECQENCMNEKHLANLLSDLSSKT